MAEFKKAESLPDINVYLQRLQLPKRAVVTAAMAYANGPLHLGHLAGSNLPPDVYSRWLGMAIGRENVKFVNGTDDHGSATELSAKAAGVSTEEFLASIHKKQYQTLKDYNIDVDIYSGTSQPDLLPILEKQVHHFFKRMYANKLLTKKSTMQWYDESLSRFLQDRFVTGSCPNTSCESTKAFSDECEACGSKYDASELQNPISKMSGTTPILKETNHLWLNMWEVSDVLRTWIESKKRSWRKAVYNEIIQTVLPSFSFLQTHKEWYQTNKATLPKHKSRFAPGGRQVLQFGTMELYTEAKEAFKKADIDAQAVDGWAHRSITRDLDWGISIPEEIKGMEGKTMYVWPESLIAPIAFTELLLQKENKNTDYKDYWCNPESKIYQFLGQDNVYFYTLMQGSMWLATQDDPQKLPQAGDLQMTEIFGSQHLQINNEKMSKSTGNYYTGDQLIHEKGYDKDQIRYFLCSLDLSESTSNFSFEALNEKNNFLAGPLNASFEKPISACIQKFGGVIPEGELHEKVAKETTKIIQRYFGNMPKSNHMVLLGAIENYARLINSMFSQYKPHDDRHDEQDRRNALYSSFYVLKNVMIMLYPFVPSTMERLCDSLNLSKDIFHIKELASGLKPGHKIGEMGSYFPETDESKQDS